MTPGSSQRAQSPNAEAANASDDPFSPTDGYFNALPSIPQDEMIPDPEQRDSPAAKEQEAREAQEERQQRRLQAIAASSSRRPHSPAASSIVSASDRQSVDTSLSDTEEQRPRRPQLPTYDDAIAERPYLGPTYATNNQRSYRTMTSPQVTGTNDQVDLSPGQGSENSEAQPLLNRGSGSGDGSRSDGGSEWRRRGFGCWRSRSTIGKSGRRVVKKTLLILLLVFITATLARLIVFIAEHRRKDEKKPVSDDPKVKLPDGASKICSSWPYRVRIIARIDDPDTLDIAQVSSNIELDGGPESLIHHGGEIHITKAGANSGLGEEGGVLVSVDVYASHTFLSRSMALNAEYDTVILEMPTRYYGSVDDADRLCMYTVTHIMVSPGHNFSDFSVSSEFMDIAIASGLDLGENTKKVNLTSLDGQVKAPYLESSMSGFRTRNLQIVTQSGSITGAYPLFDGLTLKSTAGLIDVNVDLKEANPYDPKPAKLVIETIAGHIKAIEPAIGNIRQDEKTLELESEPLEKAVVDSKKKIRVPARDYRTRLYSTGGGIKANVVHGSETVIKADAGTVNVSLAPHGDQKHGSSIDVHMLSARSDLFIGKCVDDPETRIGNMSMLFRATTGDHRLAFPPTWEGSVQGSSVSGIINVDWPDFRVHEFGKDPFNLPFTFFRGSIGKGNSSLTLRSISGHSNIVGYGRRHDSQPDQTDSRRPISFLADNLEGSNLNFNDEDIQRQ